MSNLSETSSDLSRALAALQSAGEAEVCEDGERLAELTQFQYEVRQQGNATFLHLWSEERNLVRRVLRVAEDAAGRFVLDVQRFGKSKPGKLEFLAATGRPAARVSREKFRARFRRLLLTQFPDEQIETLTSAPDLEHSFSGSYTRGVTHRGQRAWAVLGVSSAEDASTIDAALTFGLLWLDWTRGHAGRRVVEGLRLILPEGSARVAAHWLHAIVPSANVELYELHEAAWRLRRVDPRDAGNLLTWLTPRREAEETRAAARGAVEQTMALAPGAIDAIVPPGTREVALRFRGLEFARWQGGRLHYGLCGDRRATKTKHRPTLEALVQEMERFRNPLAPDKNHPLYRAAAERWLESLALEDITRIDARLDAAHVYPQVPALSGSGPDSAGAGRGVMDLLGVTHEGRLAVIELKASEDIHLAMQGMDYWLRVRWHLQQGDFPRYGYFTGVELQPKPPLLYLVAPGFRFHPATDTLLRYILPEVECVRVGLNEDWRQGLKIVFRQ
ncbi:MAG: hypothetical protein HY234_03590 [Acidobacteria bacterium]|nr:hypothetical protein [Acidobacteriota bacterium]MBI3662119.1 hypothetical protein [Acidobacteriota bacterium]